MAFNGGRSQVNFNSLQTGGEYPFLNCLKTAQVWTLVDNSAQPAPTTLNSDGYPTSISNGGVATVFFIPSATDRPGLYRVRWTGTGTVDVTGLGSYSGGDTTFTPGDTRISLQITANTNMSNLQMFHVDDGTALDAGQVFGTRFKAKLTEGNFGVLRFLNWQSANASNVRYWADRKPTTYVFYHGDEMRGTIYGGTTTNVADAYSVAAPSGWTGLVDKAIVTVKWNASASGDAATLNVGSTGAKAIRGASGEVTSSDYNNRPLSGKVGTLVYDSDLDCWLKSGGDLAFGHVWLTNGVPPELCLQLASEVGAHPWFCPPYLSCDPITDWITGLATYCRDNAPSWMIPRYEVTPNECWNEAGGFYSTVYGYKKSFAHWAGLAGTIDIDDWAGKSASLQGQAVSAVYSANTALYHTILGVHTYGDPAPNARLNSTLYVSQNGGSAAKNWVTHVCCANYFRDTYSDAERTQAGIDYAAAVGAPAKLVIATAFVDSALVGTAGAQYQFSLPRLNTLYIAWKAWAAGLGVSNLVGYEGGWSPDYTGNATTDALYAASKAVAGLSTYTTTNYTNFASAGGLFPSCFQLGGASNVWSVFDPDIYATPSPQWTAICAYNVYQTRRSGLRLRLHS